MYDTSGCRDIITAFFLKSAATWSGIARNLRRWAASDINRIAIAIAEFLSVAIIAAWFNASASQVTIVFSCKRWNTAVEFNWVA
jgi:anti-sigma regulatory factor (Ser/Thr protein kinase)